MTPSKPTRPASSSGDPLTGSAPEEALKVRAGAGEVFLGVWASPAASRTALKGLHGGRLKVSLTAPPEDNRANRQLEETLAEWLGIPRARVRVDTGHAGRDKVVAFTGIEEADLRKKLSALLALTRPAR